MPNEDKQSEDPQLSESLARFLDGEPEPGDEAVLLNAITKSSKFAQEFSDLLAVDELLKHLVTDHEALVDAIRISVSEGEGCEQFVKSVNEKIYSTHRYPKKWWITLSIVLIPFLVLPFIWPLNNLLDSNRDASSNHNAHDSIISENLESVSKWAAILRKAIDVNWADNANALKVGEMTTARRLKIENGFIELQMDRGALVRLKGPADLEIIDGMEICCYSGKIQVDVPPTAYGFVVRTPSVTVVDKGTSFAIDVGAKEKTEVHVIKGMVELFTSSNEEKYEILEGNSVEVIKGVIEDIAHRHDGFPSAELMSSRENSAIKHAVEAWKRRREVIAKDPSCLVYFDFDNNSVEPILLNHAMNADPRSNGTVVGCGSVDGRWPEKQALEFKNTFDRLLVQLQGDIESLSCVASIRLDSMPLNPIPLMTFQHGSLTGLEWNMVLGSESPPRGRLELIRNQTTGIKTGNKYLSKSFLRPEQVGTWICLAFIWDSHNNVCHQYVNGKLTSMHQIKDENRDDSVQMLINELVVGNGFFANDPGNSTKGYFSGRIDEIAVFNRAISVKEIRTYQDLSSVVWSGGTGDGQWDQQDNWTAGITPAVRDHVVIDTSGSLKAHYSHGDSPDYSALRIGSTQSRSGELLVTGGHLLANRNSNAHSRVGVAGGRGIMTQRNGSVTLNSLQIGLDSGSYGTYLLEGGKLLISRDINGGIGSIDIGPNHGHGSLQISGGSLLTRNGIVLGRKYGIGEFKVYGSKASEIKIGSHLNGDGFWRQNQHSTLQLSIDSVGVTPIFIDDVNDDGGGNVTFEAGSLLDVNFIGEQRAGSWDAMQWEGTLTDKGLNFASTVDQNLWSFEFVDTDQSGSPDTLRVIAVSE